jgi:hypothetical protein
LPARSESDSVGISEPSEPAVWVKLRVDLDSNICAAKLTDHGAEVPDSEVDLHC